MCATWHTWTERLPLNQPALLDVARHAIYPPSRPARMHPTRTPPHPTPPCPPHLVRGAGDLVLAGAATKHGLDVGGAQPRLPRQPPTCAARQAAGMPAASLEAKPWSGWEQPGFSGGLVGCRAGGLLPHGPAEGCARCSRNPAGSPHVTHTQPTTPYPTYTPRHIHPPQQTHTTTTTTHTPRTHPSWRAGSMPQTQRCTAPARAAAHMWALH